LALQAQLWNILTDKEKKLAMSFGEQFKFNLFETVKHMRTALDAKNKPYIKESRHATIVKRYTPKKAIYEQNRKHLELTNFFYERMLLGYSYSVKLGVLFEKYFSGLITVAEVNEAVDKDRVSFVAVVSEKPVERTSVNKNKYARFQLSDETGIVQGMVFNTKTQAKLDEIKEKHGGKLPPKDTIVFCYGQKKGDTVFLDNIADQCVKIYTKFGQIEKDTGQSNPVE
jgi:DNA polymerase III alpha subunit